LLRISGAPAGHAVITTTMAALDTMSGEIWYPHFEKHFSKTIALCGEARDQILARKYSFHQSAALYGVDKRAYVIIDGTKHSIEQVKGKISVIAASCQGLINALKESVANSSINGFALANAEALKKASSNAPLMTMKIQMLITSTIEKIGATRSIAQMTSIALTQLTDESVAKAQEMDNSGMK
jgi:hypothetical protein